MKNLSENEINNLSNDEALKKLLMIQARGYKKLDDIHFVLMALFVMVLLGCFSFFMFWLTNSKGI